MAACPSAPRQQVALLQDLAGIGEQGDGLEALGGVQVVGVEHPDRVDRPQAPAVLAGGGE